MMLFEVLSSTTSSILPILSPPALNTLVPMTLVARMASVWPDAVGIRLSSQNECDAGTTHVGSAGCRRARNIHDQGALNDVALNSRSSSGLSNAVRRTLDFARSE